MRFADAITTERYANGHRFQFDTTSDAVSDRTRALINSRGPEFFIIKEDCPRGFAFEPCVLLEATIGDWIGFIPSREIFILHERP